VLADRAGEFHEWPKPRATGPREPGAQRLRRLAWIVESVEQAELFLQEEGAVEPAVGLLDVGEDRELFGGLALGRLEQRPARALDPLAAGRRRLALVFHSWRRTWSAASPASLTTCQGSKQISASGIAALIACS
jgi:hypothetical protein